MRDRRSYERLALNGHVNLKTENGSLRISNAYLDNISFNGFTMHAIERTEPDMIVDFELMPQSLYEPLAGKGKIRYVKAQEKYKTVMFTMGIEFIDINKDIVTHLIKRVQLKLTNETKEKGRTRPIDFLPY